MIDKIISKLKAKKIAILGFGREGKTSYEFIRKYLPNQVITIIDKVNVINEELEKDDNIEIVYGDNYINNLDKYDLILKTPGISLINIDDSKIIDKITSQIELVLECHKEHVIGITGTKGKSTTTSLIYEILKQNNIKCLLCGNIGIPVFSMLDDIDDDTYLVIEMSSHQLEYLNVSPHIGIILNLFQDHLDHAGSVEYYYKSKLNMFKYQSDKDYMIYFKDNNNLKKIVNDNYYLGNKLTVSLKEESDIYLKENIVYYENREVFNKDIDRNLLGEHNFINIMFAFLVAKLFKIEDSKILKVIKEFKSLPYRLEHFTTINNVKYYVDTLATIPEATLEAVNSIKDVNTLIFGGMDRGISYAGFADKLSKTNVEHFICMPTTGHDIGKKLPKDKVYYVDTLEEAANLAKKITKPGTSCILSPAAASYEYFKNYQEKGDKFKEYIETK